MSDRAPHSKGNYTQQKWLLLLFELPTSLSNLRVKVWRKLQKIGAVNLKGSVWALPGTEETKEDFAWLAQEIEDGGGQAFLMCGQSLSDRTEEAIITLFQHARDKEYEEIIEAGEEILEQCSHFNSDSNSSVNHEILQLLSNLKHKFKEIQAVDFFPSIQQTKAREQIEAISVAVVKAAKHSQIQVSQKVLSLRREDYKGKIWVTRQHMHIDRLSCAWLIRRFIDSKARFQFVASYQPPTSKDDSIIPFDMAGGILRHHNDNCTFETMVHAFGFSDDKALISLSQIVHDVDNKDKKFGRPEAGGIDLLVRSLSSKAKDDHALLKSGIPVFDALYHGLKGRR